MRKEKLEELKTYIEELKTIKLTKINQDEEKDNFLGIEKYDCTLNNGNTFQREKLIKGKKDGSAAIILPITKEGNTLLVVQPRVYTKSTVGIELPAGYIEEGEDPVVAARRELVEETGYVPEDMKLVANYYQDQGCSAAFDHSYLALGCEKKLDQNLDKDEIIRYFECNFEEALELIENNYINDAGSIITIEKSKQYVKRYLDDKNK